MSLLQGVLRSHVPDSAVLEKRLNNVANGKAARGSSSDEDDDELVNVVSHPSLRPPQSSSSVPCRSRYRAHPPAPARPHPPATVQPPARYLGRCTSHRAAISSNSLPTELSQRIFRQLSLRDLAKCALVSKKWSRSQTINYVWFQHYRNDSFHDDSLPAGKWTKRESKQNWNGVNGMSRVSGYSSPLLKEEKLRLPGKIEMRSLYKELGGRKSKEKSKVGQFGGGGGDGDY
ncbi:hypothetical protein B0H14DRAFT_3087435 [Mycena olivaceomarginata]|nr:hypothetical protein B0H14DRAFT_3087435 [Mycena olivaceomarginata]